MGILPMLFSYPQALVWGANPITLVSGGTVIWVLVVVSTFWLAWRAYGPAVAGWAIVPLVFSSTGDDLAVGTDHRRTPADAGLAHAGVRGALCLPDARRLAARRAPGLWCGLGLYLDAMFLFTLAGIVPAAVLAWLSAGRSRSGIGLAAVFLVAMIVGLLPREIGRRVDPYDAYPVSVRGDVRHVGDRGTRPAAGLRLPAAPDRRHRARRLEDRSSPESLGDGLASAAGGRFDRRSPAKEWLAVLLVIGFAAAVVRLARDAVRRARSGPAGGQPRHARLGTPDRRGLPGEPQHLQFGQLSVPDLPADPLVAGLRARAATTWRGAGSAGRLAAVADRRHFWPR